MAEITPDKLELLRTALPKGLSAGDSGLAGFPEKPLTQPMSWPQFQATTTDTKLYTGSPAITETPQILQSQAAEFAPHPWKIYIKTEDNNTQVKVEYNSTIYKSFKNFEKYSVTGLDTYISVEEGFVFVEAEVMASNFTVTSQKIMWGKSDMGERITFDEDNQTKYILPIAYIYKNENDSWIIRQLAFTDFSITQMCIDGKAAIYPIA